MTIPTTTTTSPSTQRRSGGRSTRVRAAVFAATLEELRARGYAAASIAGIAARAGVHETSIYRRWGTKAALALDALSAQAEEALPVPDTGNLRGDLTALLHEVVRLLHSPAGKTVAQIAVAAGDDAESEQLSQLYWANRFASLEVIVRRAVTRNELPADADVRLLIETVIGPIYVRALFTHEPLDDATITRIVTLVLQGATATDSRAAAPFITHNS